MKLAQIVEKSDAEMKQFIDDTRAQLSKVRIEMRTKKVTNVKEILATKRLLARALTIQRQREISQLENTK